MLKRISAVLLVLLLCTNVHARPKHKDVELKSLTTLTLRFYPGMGTRFTFPFVLDNDDNYVPYTNDNTNSTVFVPIKRQQGRNFFVVTVPPDHLSQPGDIGNMFITVAGYQISIEMHTTKQREEHIADVRFTMGKKAREDLIQHAIEQRSKTLEQAWQEKQAQQEQLTDKAALAKVGMLALHQPDKRNIKEESALTLNNGDETVLFVDTALVYPQYTIYAFAIENDSAVNHVAVRDARLFALDDKSGQKIPLDTARQIPKRVEPRGAAQGVIVVENRMLDPDKRLSLEVLTDGGKIQAAW